MARPTLDDDQSTALGSVLNPINYRDRETLRLSYFKAKERIPDYLMSDRHVGVVLGNGNVVGTQIKPADVPEVQDRYFKHQERLNKEESLKRAPAYDGSADRIFDLYGIPRTTPLREKIERLLLAEVAKEDVVDLLSNQPYNHNSDAIEQLIEEVVDGWVNLGTPLSEDALKLEKGKAVARLQMLKKDVYGGPNMRNDPRMQQLAFQIEKEYTELLGLDKLKVSPDEEATEDELAKALDHMSPEKLKELLEALD